MTTSIPDFWRLLTESQLLPAAECQRLAQQYGAGQGGDAHALSQWLVAQNIISSYQAAILLGGRPGPFAYGDYKIYDRADAGPLTGQFKAVHAVAGHPVLLKFFAGETVSDPQRWAATAQRAMQHTQLTHPHWWRSFELADLDQFKFFAVADIAGQTVPQRLKANGPIPHREACRLAYQAALALARVHDAGFMHGNVRPENILIDGQGRGVLWCDPAAPWAGFAMTATDEATLTRADYAAPELASAGKTPDALCDVYALGCTFYQMLSGHPPFAGGTVAEKMQRHASEAIQPLASFGVPEALAKTIAYMMAKNTTVRYATASQAADQLGQFLDSADRQPKVAAARPTLAAMEQYLRQKPKPSPVRPVTTAQRPAANVAKVAAVVAPAAVSGASTASSPVTTPAASDRFRKKQPLTKNMPLMFAIGGGLAFLLTLGALAASGIFNGGSDPIEVVENGIDDGGATDGANTDGENTDGEVTTDSTGDGGTVDPPDPRVEAELPRFLVGQDDGNSLWAPPTMGDPVELFFVPTAARMYLIARPSEILASTHGQDVLKALGPDFDSWRQNWERTAGVTLSEVEQLIVGIYPNDSQMPRFSHTVTLKTAADMKARWNNPPAAGENLYSVAGKKAWLPPGGEGRVFVLGAAEEIDSLAKSSVPRPKPQLDPYFTQLLKSSDGQQQFIALIDPQFLQTDGRDMFTGPYEKLLAPLDWFFGDDTKALFSANFSGEFYGELRMYSRLQKTPAEMREEYGGKIDAIGQGVLDYMAELDPPTYWRRLYLNIPTMVNVAQSQIRSGIEGDETVYNIALPGQAAPNMIAATELSIATAPGAIYAPDTGGPTTVAKTIPKTLDEVLEAKVDLGFPQQSLEFSMRDLVTAVKEEYPELSLDFQVKILGPDLQKDGITRNQQIRDVSEKGTPVRDILTQLVRKANPVTTVTDPSEVDQKLVWLTGPDPEDASKTIVLITTRTAAGEKKLTLPAVFQPK